MQKIRLNLWFDNQAEEAAGFCVSLFDDSAVGSAMRSGPVTIAELLAAAG